MALILQFFHLVRLSIMPIIWYKVKEVQGGPPEHGEHGGEGGEGGH